MSLTSCVAIDCEMVGGFQGESLAARVAVVNEYGQVLLDKYIKPPRPVADYRSFVSGISERDLSSAEPLNQVANQVSRLIVGRTLVGHSLDVDLGVLGLTHPGHLKRDLAAYPRFMNGGQPTSLKVLAAKLLGRHIQVGTHSPVEDAKAAMDIYRSVAGEW